MYTHVPIGSVLENSRFIPAKAASVRFKRMSDVAINRLSNVTSI